MIHFHVEQRHEILATIDEIHVPIDEVMSMDKQLILVQDHDIYSMNRILSRHIKRINSLTDSEDLVLDCNGMQREKQ